MKLHLPLSLRSSLFAVFAASAVAPVMASTMHGDASLVTYTDFGQNAGRYDVGVTNQLLQHIREQAGGIVISYTGGQEDYVIPLAQGMIDFSSTFYHSTAAAISPSMIVTVGHNGEISSNFTSEVAGIGAEHAIHYTAVGDRYSSIYSNYAYNANSVPDWRVTRESKIFTDVTPAVTCSGNSETYNLAKSGLFYHAGSGTQSQSGSSWSVSGYNFTTGGIAKPTSVINNPYSGGAYRGGVYVTHGYDSSSAGVNENNPLPFAANSGDSGSPVFVYDGSQYKLWGSVIGMTGSGTSIYNGYAEEYNRVIHKYDVAVDLAGAESENGIQTVWLHGVNQAVDGRWVGSVQLGSSEQQFCGLLSGLNTWGDLSDLKDTQNWYAYDGRLQQRTEALFFTENLLFSTASEQNKIILNDTVDLGIGYAEFSGGKYTIVSAAGENNLFNHAGYVINEGAEVHLQLTNTGDYMREWRKTGSGHLYIEGQGNNDVLLNLGGSGTVYLNREGGYAAYNVLANNGAKVVISNTNQIKRDFTFGNGGGTLDMNGCSMDWYTTAESAESNRVGFSINALTEDALIVNSGGSSTLTYRESGNTIYRGSFADSETGSLKVVYDTVGGTWMLNSIRTNLQHADSGLQVVNGRVILSGTNTIHGLGSDMPSSTGRYTHEDDWHYADATMNVAVEQNAVFELGSHARLVGDVTVEQNGVYVMREGVRHRMEYVEGGMNLEDTGKYSAYFGHKGDVNLNGGTFSVEFNEGVDSQLQYAGSVTGTGTMTVDTGTQGGSFAFSGTVNAGVSKVLNRGILELSGAAAADTTNRWLVNAGGVMLQQAVAADTLSLIDTSSTGTLGLNADTDSMLDMSQHSGLYVGALAGATVQYGNAEETVAPTGNLNLGGAGGHLVVNIALTGDFDLNLRAGTVTLTHAGNAFSANVNAQVGSTLLFADAEAAQNVHLSGGYGVRLNTQAVMLPDFRGALLVQAGMGDISLADSPMAALGAAGDVTYSGNISLATGAAYHFGGITGTLTVDSQVGGAHALVVDNQGYEGGVLQLNNISNLTGKVTVQGSDDQHEGGSVLLAVTQDNALSQASAIELKNGGTLELNGTAQTFGASFVSEAGSAVRDSSAGGSALVTFNLGRNDTLDIYGTIDADVSIRNGRVISHGADSFKQSVDGADAAILELQWSGEGALSGGNYTNLSKLQVTSGSVTVTGKLDAATIQVNSGAQYATGSSHDSAFVLSGAGMAGATHQGALSLAGNVTMSGSVTLQSASTINVVSGWSATISGAVDARNYTLTKSGEGALTLSGNLSNASNIRVEGGKLTLNSYNTGQNLVLAGGGELAVTNWGTRSEAASIKDGSKLVLSDSGDFCSNVSGNGTLHVQAAGQDMYVYNCSFSDANSGRLAVEYSGTSYMVIESSNSYTGGTTLNGIGQVWFTSETAFGRGRLTQRNGTLVLYNHDLKVDSLAGNGTITKYSCDSINLTGAVSSADSVAQYTGNLSGGIKVQKSGAYTQEFVLNSDTTLPSVTVNGGSLVFRSDRALNLGSVNVASGSTLALGGAGSKTLGTSTINGVLDLAGMNPASTHLDITAGATVTFGNNAKLMLGEVEEGKTYTVFDTSANGATLRGWSADNITIDSSYAHHASFELLNNGQVKYIGGEHYHDLVWSGAAAGTWDSSTMTWTRESDASQQRALKGDSVIFDGNIYTIELGDDIQVSTVTVRNGASLSLNNAGNHRFQAERIRVQNASISYNLNTSAILELDGGLAQVSGSKILKSDIYISNGGWLSFEGSGADTLDHDAPKGTSIVVDGGIVTIGDTRQTMGNWELVLSNGANVSGSGGSYSSDGATHKAALDFNVNNSTISVASGNNTISAVTRLRNGNNLNYDVSEGATLTVSGLIHADGAAGKGSITKNGAGKLVLTAANTYANTTTINGGTLSTSVVGALGSSSVVINDGGTLLLGGNNNQLLGEDITINAGGTLRFDGTGSDIINYNLDGKTLTVAGGTIDFGSTRQTMGNWALVLSDGATITGAGNATYGAIDFNNNNSTITATSGENTISAVTRVRNGDNLNYDVSEGATLTVSGLIHSAGSANKASITKLGEGQMILSSNLNLNYLSTRDGEVLLTGAQNTVANVDCSMGSTAEGTLRLAQDACLEVTGNIWSRNNTGILLDSGAELNISGKKLTITNREEEGTASLAATTSTDPGEYTINRTGYQISNAHVTYTGGDATINNLLTNSSIENAGSGTLKVNNAENTLSAVHATGGSVKLFSDAELDLKELEIATSFSISAYIQLSERESEEARINVVGTADFGKGVTLNADLVMKSGSTLMIEDTVQLSSDALRLESGLTLAGTQYDILSSLSAGGAVTIFSGIETLVLGNSDVACNAFSLNDRVQANEYFTNLSDRYFLVFDTSAGVGMGELSIASMPEPTTTTLSILALAGLVARRRRR